MIDRPFATYRYLAALQGRTFHAEREYVIRQKEILPAQFAEYRAFVTELGKVARSVGLEAIRPWAWNDTYTIDWYSGTTATAADTLASAAKAANRGDLQEALASIRDLLKADPDNPVAPLHLAWTYSRLDNRERAIDTLRDPLRTHPTPSVIKMLAASFQDAKKPDEAIAVWQQGRTLFPDDREIPLYLGEALLAQKRFAEAEAALAPAEAAQRDSARWHWNVALARASNGKPDDAIASFRRVVEIDGTPGTLNKVAWEMVERGIGLPDALVMAERSVKGAEEQSAKFTLADLKDADLAVVQQLWASWDTLGWIHFRQGNLDAAERYLLPSWQLDHNADVARHLAELYTARRNQPQADTFDAIATMLSRGGAMVATLERIAGNATTGQNIADAGNREARMRTMDVPRLPGAAGSADVLLLVSGAGKVEDVKFASGDTRLRPLAETLRDLTVPSTIPDGSVARLVRRLNLTCPPGDGPCIGVLIGVGNVKTAK